MSLDIKDFSGKLPEPWKTWIFTYFAVVFCVGVLIPLLKQFKELFPAKTSKKSKEDLLGEYLKRIDYLDKNISEHFKELQDSELFFKATKIKCKKNLRDGLLWLYRNSPSRISWEFIKPAIPYLRERDWKLYVHVPLIDLLFWLINFGSFILCIIGSFTLIIVIPYIKNSNSAVSFILFLMSTSLALLAGMSLGITVPVTRADMILSEIEKIKDTSGNKLNKKI